jgi:phage shock protein E
MPGWFSRLLSRLLPAPPQVGPDENVLFVDVRTRAEYDAGHVKGARHIPHTEVARRWKELKRHRDQRILLYCRSGRRSGIAARVLREQGFEKAENAGGIGGLKRAGFGIVKRG